MTSAKSSREQSNALSWSRIAPYAVLSLGSFVLFLFLLALLLRNAERIVALGLTGNLFYLVLVPLGLSAAAFLFGALRSFAQYRGKHFGGVLECLFRKHPIHVQWRQVNFHQGLHAEDSKFPQERNCSACAATFAS